MNVDREGASAIVLAGGKSSRMGRPKALLPFNNEPLIVHIVRRLGKIFGEIVVVAAPDQELPLLPARVVYDDLPHQGPVGGIYYGLQSTTTDLSFACSCDVPFLNLSLVSYLLSAASNHDVVVPYWDDRFQPLHAIYRRSVLPLLKAQLDEGKLRPIFLYEKVPTLTVPEVEIRRFDPEGLTFMNMNTPEDYQRALALWREQSN